ncbi:MAG: NfeD family protein [Candidatus Sericytochromatia bacterium]|nr:NfeD family protein [Candidatus Sericytochromatia bacterium]
MTDLLHNAQAWLAIAVLLLLAEVMTTTFFLACLAAGALAAAGAIALGHGGNEALAAFSIVSVLSLAALRPLLLRNLRPIQAVRTNVDAIVGQQGRVIVPIEPERDEGRVLVGGEDWWATSANGDDLAADTRVVVVAVNGSKLTVRVADED